VHFGEMSSEGRKLEISVVADSWVGELENIFGSLEIVHEDKAHNYLRSYKLSALVTLL